MSTKVEVIGDSLSGPYTIKLNGTVITDVESIELINEDGIHRAYIKLLVQEYQLRPAEKKSFAKGGLVEGPFFVLVGER